MALQGATWLFAHGSREGFPLCFRNPSWLPVVFANWWNVHRSQTVPHGMVVLPLRDRISKLGKFR